MNLKNTLRALVGALLIPLPALAQDFDDVLDAGLLTGWRQADGSHMAAVRLTLAEGWHTYWRAPGDAGIPPLFDLSASGNFQSAEVIWPRPEVYTDNGMRSIVYHNQVILPLRVAPKAKGKDIDLNATIEIGVCKDICVPQTLNVRALLPANANARDPRIAASLADRPFSGKQAGAKNVRCQISRSTDGIRLEATLDLPRVGQREEMVIETSNPLLWVAAPSLTRNGNSLRAVTDIQHVEGAPFMLNRSGMRITVLGESRAVDIKGCKGG